MTGLTARQLHFGYRRDQIVIDGAQIDVRPGELVALVGPNGSGKSTLLRLLAGLLTPRAGRVRWNDEDLAAVDPGARARSIAFLPQSVDPLYSVRARRIVELARHPHLTGLVGQLAQADRVAVDEALVACDVAAFADREFQTLSGGERQRVLLAAALAQGGDLLLLDEPTAALDLGHQVAVMKRLRGLADGGRALVVVTHDLNLASAFATRVVLLAAGRVVVDGPASDVITAPWIERVFGPGLWVGPHPRTRRPAVLPGSEVEA